MSYKYLGLRNISYYVFLLSGEGIATFAAIVMGGVNLAEADFIRLVIAAWRHRMTFNLPLSAFYGGTSIRLLTHGSS